MTPEELEECLDPLSDRTTTKLRDHIDALEAEVAQVRGLMLDLLPEDSHRGGAYVAFHQSHCRSRTDEEAECECGPDSLISRIRALKSKPAQEAIKVGFHDHCTFGNCWCAKGERVPVEMASEENGLLPKSKICECGHLWARHSDNHGCEVKIQSLTGGIRFSYCQCTNDPSEAGEKVSP